jgi:hypothetical protein
MGEVFDFVKNLLDRHCHFPKEAIDEMAKVMLKALAPSTLRRYFEIIRGMERRMGTPFSSWLPFNQAFIH